MTVRICRARVERLTEGKVAAGSFSGRSARSATQDTRRLALPRRVVVAEART